MWGTVAAVVVITMAEMLKNLYTWLYIYAKLEAIMYKYTAVTGALGDIKSGFFQ